MKLRVRKLFIILLLCSLSNLSFLCNKENKEQPTQLITNTTAASTTYVTTAIDTSSASSSDTYSIYFIDVGQGDSILIETNQKHYVLIDSGPSDARNKLGAFLTSKGVTSIQEVILTHPHTDHYGEFKDVVGAFTIGTFLYGNYPSTNSTYKTLLDKLQQNAISTNEIKDGYTFTLDNLTFKVFHPTATFISKSGDNNNSVALKISNQSGIDFLTCGDLEIEGINSLIARHKNDIDVELLKINHHGSNTGTNEAFLDATTPTDAFISVGTGNSYGHPHQPVLDLLKSKGIKMYRTDQDGSIEVEVKGKSYESRKLLN